MRADREHYFMEIAKVVATRSTCDRLFVGSVLVRDNRIIATGYNGAAAGQPQCDEVGHEMEDGHCVRTIHSEHNAIIQCAYAGVSSKDAVIYITHMPCYNCQKLLINAGVKEVIYNDDYTFDKSPLLPVRKLRAVS